MASFGFGTLSSQGVGSNIDLSGIVDKLMDLERIPLNRLIAKRGSFEAKISVFGTIKSALSELQTSLAGLKSGSTFQASSAVSSDASIVKATGTSGAVAGNYTISNITALAQSQKLVAAGQADATAAIGAGTSTTLTIDLGTTSGASFTTNSDPSFDVVIDSSNNTLEGIRDAINAADGGVTATIVNDGGANPYRLVLSSTDTGADQSMQIVVAGDATLTTLLNHDPTGVTNLTETVAAQNAVFQVDGLDITKSSNTITDVISGVTLTLNAENPTGDVIVSVSQDTDSAKEAIETFIAAYNEVHSLIKDQTDPENDKGAFGSDSATRRIYSVIRDEMTQAPSGITGSYTNLSSIGITFQRDGSIALDEDVLDSAILADSDNVEELFSSADGYATRLDSLMTDMLSLNGTLEARLGIFEQRVQSFERREVNMEDQLIRIEERLRRKFSALDGLVGRMNVTSNYLTQQLAGLNNNR